MAKYIDKSALVAEIKRRMNENRGKQTLPQYFGMIEEDLNILSFINTIEVKEVDFEKEFHKWIEDNTCRGYCSANIHETAEHFFELGLKGQNENT